MVANVGQSEDTLHMRGWGLEASSLDFNPTYSLGSYNTQGPGGAAIRKLSLLWHSPSLAETWGCDRKDSVFGSNSAQPFLGCRTLGQPTN